jgi:exosortase
MVLKQPSASTVAFTLRAKVAERTRVRSTPSLGERRLPLHAASGGEFDPKSLTWRDGMGALLLLAAAGLALRPLAAFWNANENEAFGWGVPFLAAYLLFERWRSRPETTPGREDDRAMFRLGWIVMAWALVFLAMRLVIETEPASRPLLWIEACLAASALLAWFGLLGGWRWLRHFLFPVAFVLVGVPWIFRCEFFLTQELMRLNAAWVAGTLTLLDVPARAAGNTIVLANAQLGVTDACSGIRSLRAALMMGLFFGEFYRFGARGRGALLGASAALALLGNYVRMLFLAWRGARAGAASVEAAHDSAGFSILAFTILSLWLIGLTTRPAPAAHPSISRTPSIPARRLAWRWACGVAAAVLVAEVATQGWYGWREQGAPRFPTWTVAWPVDAPGFCLTPIPVSVHDELHDGASTAADWRDAAGWHWSGWWIRYHADATGKVVFESHNPELCLPAAGWRELPGGGAFLARAGAVHLAVQGHVFVTGDNIVYVFWIPYLDSQTAAGADEMRGVYGHSLAALAEGKMPWLADVWSGCRGADAETLELALSGPGDYAGAKRSVCDLLSKLVRPDAVLAVDGR